MRTNIQHRKKRSKAKAVPGMMTLSQLIYEQALKDFPYPNLIATGGYSEYEVPDPALVSSLEYAFDGKTLVEELRSRKKVSPDDTVDGWVLIDFWNHNGEITIDAVGDIARNGDWKRGRLLPEYRMLYGSYDVQEREWDFWISR